MRTAAGSEAAGGGETIRDPLWNTIVLDGPARRVVDSPPFQRLRYIRQLGLAYLTYPGATHTRFDHALGVHHLACRAVALLASEPGMAEVDPVDRALVPLAALLHDLGHYPFSHALEELGRGRTPGNHEALVGRFLTDPAIADVLAAVTPDGPARVEALVRGRSPSPLQGLVSGSLDLDKIEYLRRDAFFCGVPYGAVDVDRLLQALVLARDPAGGRYEVGIHEKGLSALESLLFSKYQMFRNVYWHHAVRAATALYKRLVEDALAAGVVEPEDLVGHSDEGMLALLERRAQEAGGAEAERMRARWLPSLRNRLLPKRAVELPGSALRDTPIDQWLYAEPDLLRTLEDRLAHELGLPDRGLFLDYPSKPRIMGLDLLLRRRDGSVIRLTERGHPGLIGLPRVADELYHTARILRVFTIERRHLPADRLLSLLGRTPEELRRCLAAGEPLL